MKTAINRTCPHFICKDKKDCPEHTNGLCTGVAGNIPMCGCDTCEHLLIQSALKICNYKKDIVGEINKPTEYIINLNEIHAETWYEYEPDYEEPDPIIYP